MHAMVHLTEKTYFFFVREEFLPKILKTIVSKNVRNFFPIKKYYVHTQYVGKITEFFD